MLSAELIGLPATDGRAFQRAIVRDIERRTSTGGRSSTPRRSEVVVSASRSASSLSSLTLPGQSVLGETALGVGGQLGDRPSKPRGLHAHEIAKQRRHIVTALPQRRHLDVERVIREKRSSRNTRLRTVCIRLLCMIAISRTSDGVDERRADALHHARIHEAMQPALAGASSDSRRPCSTIVPPSAASRRPRELQGSRTRRAGFRVPKELALEPRIRQAHTVHRDERPALPRAAIVNGPRDQPAPDAALPRNQHGGVGLSGFGDLISDSTHRRAMTDQHERTSHVRQLAQRPRRYGPRLMSCIVAPPGGDVTRVIAGVLRGTFMDVYG